MIIPLWDISCIIYLSNICIYGNKEVFVKHEKAPTAPRFEGVLAISYMPMFWKNQSFGAFSAISGGRKCQKAHLHTKTFHLNLFTCLYDHKLHWNNLEKLMFRKTAVLGSFGHIRATFGIRMWPKLPKGTSKHQDLSFAPTPTSIRLSFTRRDSLKNLIFLAKFGHFRWSILAKTAKRHIYRPRPFIWAYSQVSATIRYKETAVKSSCFENPLFLDIRYKDTAWKRIDDGQTDGQKDGHPESIGPQLLGLGPNKVLLDTSHRYLYFAPVIRVFFKP